MWLLLDGECVNNLKSMSKLSQIIGFDDTVWSGECVRIADNFVISTVMVAKV